MRALLSVAGDDPARLAQALASGADALIVDVAAVRVLPARIRAGTGSTKFYVRIDSLREENFAADVAAAIIGRPHGVVLAHAEGPADVDHLAALLGVEEALADLPDGGVRIVAVVDTARGELGLHRLAGPNPRLEALGWDAAALAADLGAESAREADGAWIGPLAQARSMLLLAAAALGLKAVDTASGADLTRFQADAEAARRHGFAAKIATNEAEVAALRRL